MWLTWESERLEEPRWGMGAKELLGGTELYNSTKKKIWLLGILLGTNWETF